jgi:hypothetical protein
MRSQEWCRSNAVIFLQLHMCLHMVYTHFCQSVSATLAQELSTHISGTSDLIHLWKGVLTFTNS